MEACEKIFNIDHSENALSKTNHINILLCYLVLQFLCTLRDKVASMTNNAGLLKSLTVWTANSI